MKRILVFGATGLVGRHLVSLLARNARVTAVTRSRSCEALPADRVELDLSQPLDPARLPDTIDAVVYLAQSPRYHEFPEGAGDVQRVNVDQPVAIAEVARRRGARQFIYASSGSVYEPGPRPHHEADPAPASSFYAASKLAAEILLRPYAEYMNVVLLRFFFIYGKGQDRRMLLPRLTDRIGRGDSIDLGSGDGMRLQPLHAGDAAAAIASALEIEGLETINVAGPETLSLRSVSETIGKAVGKAPVFGSTGGAGGDFVADTSRMHELLGPPRTTFGDRVDELLP